MLTISYRVIKAFKKCQGQGVYENFWADGDGHVYASDKYFLYRWTLDSLAASATDFIFFDNRELFCFKWCADEKKHTAAEPIEISAPGNIKIVEAGHPSLKDLESVIDEILQMPVGESVMDSFRFLNIINLAKASGQDWKRKLGDFKLISRKENEGPHRSVTSGVIPTRIGNIDFVAMGMQYE